MKSVLDSPNKHRLMSLASRINAIHRALTAEELAELLHMSRITILRRAKRGSIPSFRVGSCVRFDSAAIAKWLMQQGVRSLPPARGQHRIRCSGWGNVRTRPTRAAPRESSARLWRTVAGGEPDRAGIADLRRKTCGRLLAHRMAAPKKHA